jgi:hypothetical protein
MFSRSEVLDWARRFERGYIGGGDYGVGAGLYMPAESTPATELRTVYARQAGVDFAPTLYLEREADDGEVHYEEVEDPLATLGYEQLEFDQIQGLFEGPEYAPLDSYAESVLIEALRALAATLPDPDTLPIAPDPSAFLYSLPTPAPPKRHRRTKAQMQAARAADAEGTPDDLSNFLS